MPHASAIAMLLEYGDDNGQAANEYMEAKIVIFITELLSRHFPLGRGAFEPGLDGAPWQAIAYVPCTFTWASECRACGVHFRLAHA